MDQPPDTISQQNLPAKQKRTLLILAILLVVLPISIWAVNTVTPKPPKAASLPLGTVRINPEQIITDIKGNIVYLSALAYDTGGSPISSGISYQWGFSTTNSIGEFVSVGTTNLASFKPSISIKGRGDIWVKAFGLNGQMAIKSIPVYVGVVPIESILGSVRINPEQISTIVRGNSINLSALAYTAGGTPLWEGITYQWGISSTNAIGQLLFNSNTKLSSFEPSHVTGGLGDIWVRASDEGGHTVMRSIAVIVAPAPVLSPILMPTNTPINTPTPTPISIPSILPTIIASTPTPIVCLPADINKDGIVNTDDRNTLLTYYLTTGPIPSRTDINNDGVVDITDYSIFVAHFGKTTGACQ